MAECHPVGFQWVMEAQGPGRQGHPHRPAVHPHLGGGRPARAAAGRQRHRVPRRHRQLHPRATRSTSSEYVVAYTNAATILREDFRDTEDLDGVFSGYDPETGTYDTATWQYEGDEEAGGRREPRSAVRRAGGEDDGRTSPSAAPGTRWAVTAPALEHAGCTATRRCSDPRCVFQVLKRHYARYTPEMVAADVRRPRRRLPAGVRGGHREQRPRAHHGWVYSVGWTHHTVGVQYIRGVGDHPAAAGQHGPARRRHPGAARARQHPGLDRHPDAVQPAARLPADAQGGRARRPRRLPRDDHQPGAEGVLGRRPTRTPSACSSRTGATRRPRRTTSASTTCRGSPATTAPTRPSMDMLDGQGRGLLPARPEPGRRLGARQDAAAGAWRT